MNKNKNNDAVQMMRDIREKLSVKYWKHPEILKKEMEAIRKKYNFFPGSHGPHHDRKRAS